MTTAAFWQSINDQKTVHQLSLDLQSQFPKWKTTCPSDPVSGDFKGSSSDRAKGGLLICLFFNIFPLFCYSPLPPLLFTAGDSGAVRDSSRTYPTCSFKGCLQNSESSEKQKQLSRQELEEAVKDLYAKQPFSSERIQITDPKQFLDSLLPYMLRQHLISEIRQNHQTYYMIRK